MRSFRSPGAFAAFLVRVRTELPEAEKRGLEAASQVLLEEVRAEAGHYQGEVNGLPGWAELADRTKADRLKNGYTENDPLRASGELAESYEAHVDDHHAVVGSPLPRAGYLEVGHDDEGHGALPPRPILGGSLFRREDDIVRALVKPVFKALEGKL